MLAAGHSSKEIAERLGLAVTTVNNTLARAYGKLDTIAVASSLTAYGEQESSPFD